MSRAKELLKAGLENKRANSENILLADSDINLKKDDVRQSEQANDLEAVLLGKQLRADRVVKRTFEMRESHVEVLNKIVRKAKSNDKRITQSDALQFIISNWNDKFGGSHLD